MSTNKSELRLVHCAKLGRELPALPYRPFRDDLGERIYREVSQDAWEMWLEHSKMLVNEYRLDLASEQAHNTLKEKCKVFLFDDGEAEQAPPPDFVPEASS